MNFKLQILSDFELAKMRAGENLKIQNAFGNKQSTTNCYIGSIIMFLKNNVFETFFGNTMIQHAFFILIHLLSWLNILFFKFNPDLTHDSWAMSHILWLTSKLWVIMKSLWNHYEWPYISDLGWTWLTYLLYRHWP